MNETLKTYRETPVGQQLSVHFKQRAQLRREIPLFSFSLAGIVERFKLDAGKQDGDLQHV
jgi:hypothetical protein